MADFNLGDRVLITGTVKKTRDYMDSSFSIFKTEYVEDNPPRIYNAKNGTTYTEGIIVGRRFMQEGRTSHIGYDGEKVFQTTGVTHRVWIVSFDLRYKPVMCFDHQLALLPSSEIKAGDVVEHVELHQLETGELPTALPTENYRKVK